MKLKNNQLAQKTKKQEQIPILVGSKNQKIERENKGVEKKIEKNNNFKGLVKI